MNDATDGPGGYGPPAASDRRPSVDDTAAFQRFYLEEQMATAAPPPQPAPSLFHRLFVGWWKDRGA